MEPEKRASTTAPLQDWLDRLAERGGAPGGGSASGVLLGIGAALLGMVLGYGERAPELREHAARLRAEGLDAAVADATASAALGAALADDGAERDDNVRDAALTGARTAADLGDTGTALVDLLEKTAADTAPGLAADVGVAAEAIAAGLGGALITLRGDVALAEGYGAAASADLRAADARMEAARTRAAAHATRIREG